jgi:TonB-dependent receptor
VDQYEPLAERSDLREQDMETILDPDNIRADGILFAETTGEDEPYQAEQNLLAGYGMVETPLGTKALNLMAGVRYEQSSQTVESTNEAADLETGDWLPAGTLTWAFWDEMQLRAGFSKTVSRPDFRELALARFFDVESSTEIVGNPELKRATILNYDLRYEWYFSGDESLSLAGFYKSFDEPIETVVLSGTSRRRSWQNADSATNIGLEIEGRKRLGFLTNALDSFFLAGNLSLIQSKVQLKAGGDGAEFVNTSTERPLEGQSPYVVNVQLGYDDAVGTDGNLSAVVLLNVSGRRISGVGANGAPDTYEEPAPQLDFVTRHQVTEHWAWGFKAQNLLNPERLTRQGDIEVRSFRSGTAFSLGGSYTY